jgi:hypothetical protein
MMIKSLFAATALAGLALSTAATAADAKDRIAGSAPVADAAAPAAAPARAEPRYCIVDTVTGSRIPTKVCKTRSEWKKQGFDPLNP